MQFGGSGTIDEGMDVAVDASDNSYSTGYFTTTASFSAMSVTSSGVDDIYIFKTNTTGNPQWLKRAGGSGSDKALAIDADPAGNTVITGYFNGTAQFDATSLTAAGAQDIFIAKYNTAGNVVWAIKAGGTGNDAGYGVAFDRAGNVIVTGEFSGTCNFGSVVLTSASGTADVFTAKYDAAGNVLWAKKGSGPLADKGTDVVADSIGNIYVSGICSDTVTFDFTHNNSFNNAIFLIRYDAAGQEQWFRWMGSSTTAQPGGMDVKNGAITLTGDLTGTMFFFGGTGVPSLAATNPYNLFICRYDTGGTYQWSRAEGSTSEVETKAIGSRSNGNTVIAGSFKCRFTDFSLTYGDGIFCSMGYWDSYVASYDNLGNRLWARHYGGRRDDLVYGMCLRNDSLAIVTGSFEDNFVSTNVPSAYLGYGTSNVNGSGFYCSDNNYYKYVAKSSSGNKDVYINNNIDLTREPLDFFSRTSGCSRPFNDACIDFSTVTNLNCEDTLHSCTPRQLWVTPNTITSREPNWLYSWSNGSPGNFTNANASGDYWVTLTSEDGCFTTVDSVYFDLAPPPPQPLISDSKGINLNSPGPADILLCYPDSVELTCTNAAGYSVSWTPGFTAGQNPVMVTAGGAYSCTLSDAYGCFTTTPITVNIFMPMEPVIPALRVWQDTLDLNDTVDICLGDFFTVQPFDTLHNPLGSADSTIQNLKKVLWDTTTFGGNFFFALETGSPPENTFVSNFVGSYDLMITASFIRETVCDSDTVIVSRYLHVNVNPVPVINPFTVSVSASSPMVCPGDSVILVAQGAGTWVWTDAANQQISFDDTCYVTSAGFYTATADSSVTNAFGCTAEGGAAASIVIGSYPQPVVTMSPPDGIACPGDSILLHCTGTGNFNWFGPAGALPVNDSDVYVTSPGAYYCIQSPATGCNILSNTVQVIPYNNPIIIAFPAPSLCENNSVTLTIAANLGSTVTWFPPLSGTSNVQVVTDTGTYSCTVVSCGITTPLSFTVYRDTALAIITTTGLPEFCAGDSVALFANSGMAQYLWLPSGDTTTSVYVSQGGIDTLITTSQHGCKDTTTLAVTEHINTVLPPVVTDTSVCTGFPVDLTATGPDSIFWCYTPVYSDTFMSGNTVHIPALNATITYYVYTSTGLCKSPFDSVQAQPDACNDIFISNVLTPDHDNLNDRFPGKEGNYVLDLKVFNRWGNVVFETSQATVGWDGKGKGGDVVPDGTYYYVMDVTFHDSTVQNYKGSLTVIHGEE